MTRCARDGSFAIWPKLMKPHGSRTSEDAPFRTGKFQRSNNRAVAATGAHRRQRCLRFGSTKALITETEKRLSARTICAEPRWGENRHSGCQGLPFLVSNEFGWLWVAHGYRAPKLTNVKALGRTPLLQWSNIGAAAWNSLKCSDERATVAQLHGTRLARYGRTCRGHSPENQTHYLSGAWLNCTGHLSPLLHSLDGGCRGVPRSARPGWFASRAVAVSKPSSRAT